MKYNEAPSISRLMTTGIVACLVIKASRKAATINTGTNATMIFTPSFAAFFRESIRL